MPNILMEYLLLGGGLLIVATIVVLLILHRQNAKKKRILSTVVFLVTVPKDMARKEDTPTDPSQNAQDFKELIGPADQFFSSLSSLLNRDFRRHILDEQDYLGFEIISFKNEVAFYISCPHDLASIVERQIQSYYPHCNMTRVRGHNIFNTGGGQVSAAQLVLSKRFIFPIKTYKYLDADPLNNLTNVLIVSVLISFILPVNFLIKI
jgi:hypothetical protein